MTEKEKMLAGEMYRANDAQLIAERARAHDLCREFNLTGASESARRAEILQALFGRPTSAEIIPPFYCDYGYNTTLGDEVFLNFNCVFLDVMPITVGNHVLIGPSVQVYTATHPLDPEERLTGLEAGKPIAIGDGVWIGGGAILCPGVSIGAGTVIGAGSVVTRDIPQAVFAAGNPCRVIKSSRASAR